MKYILSAIGGGVLVVIIVYVRILFEAYNFWSHR